MSASVSSSAPPSGEQQRLAALRRYALLDTPPEERFDRLTRVTAKLFAMPAALVTFVDEERMWSKSSVGAALREMERRHSFCTHNIEQGGVMVVEDAWEDARFDGNPLVHEGPKIRFYAGAPLTTHDGHCLGSLCVYDFEPRRFGAEEQALLEDLAAEVMEEIELRLALPEGGTAVYADKALLAAVIDVQNEVAGSALAPPKTMALVVRRVQAITGADGACLVEADGREVKARAVCGATLYTEGQRYEKNGLCRAALEAEALLMAEDVRDDPRASQERRAQEFHSAMLMPIRAQGRVAGVLEVVARAPRAFEEKHAQALRLLAGPIEAALERARASQALDESLRRYRSLLEHLPVGVYRSTSDGRILEANEAMADLLGYDSPEALLQEGVPDLYLNEEDRARHLRQLAEENTKIDEFPLRRADGEVVWVRDYPRAVAEHEEDGVTCFDGMLLDITDRKRAEEQLAESESRLRAIVENISDLIEIVDAEGVVQYVSGAVEEITGFSEEELLGRRVFERVHPDHLPELEAKLQRLISEPGAPAEHEYRYRHRDGSWRYFSVHGRNFLDRPGIDGILGTVRDITEYKQFEQELIAAKEEAEEMARLKSAFLANMSHEIRTPLASVLGFAEVLAEEAEGHRREFAELIRQSGERLSETLNSVLELARLEGGGFEPDLARVSARRIVRDAGELFAPMAAEKGLAFEMHGPEEDLTFWADRAGVDRMLSNLISNALKFTDEGSISVQARRVGEAVQLSVSDTGSGMGPAFLENLFDEFRQESSGLSRRHEGVGLGLAITRRLADVMDAEIGVESRKGEGSTFTIAFPHPGKQEPGEAPEKEHAPLGEPAGGRVLILEDNPEARRLVEHQLRDPWKATVVADAPAVFEAAEADAYEVLLIDINLGEHRNGADVLHRLRQDDRYAQVPAVAMTAYAMPGDEEHFLKDGFDYYLAKPFTREELHQTLGKAVQAVPGAGAAE